jgi:hypothetical protein
MVEADGPLVDGSGAVDVLFGWSVVTAAGSSHSHIGSASAGVEHCLKQTVHCHATYFKAQKLHENVP